jgi:hypothetical protein
MIADGIAARTSTGVKQAMIITTTGFSICQPSRRSDATQ